MAKNKQVAITDNTNVTSMPITGSVDVATSVGNTPTEDDNSELTKVQFSTWLENVTDQYLNLEDEEKNDTLGQLIASSGPSQLCYLLKKMDILLYRDFLKLLPLELVEYLLKFLDGKSLMMCCQVNRFWNQRINSLPRVWQQACINTGYIIHEPLDNQDVYYWKSFLLEMSARRQHMKTYKSFFSRTYDRDLRRITAIFYYAGKVAAASESKFIRIWNCANDQLILSLRTDFSISGIKFDDENLVASSYLGHLVLWNIHTGDRLFEFMRHAGAVFSFDFSMPLKLLVSGGADNKIKLWSLVTSGHYKTLSEHKMWVLKTSLLPYPAENNSKYQNQHLLISMDKTCIWVRLVSSTTQESHHQGTLFLRTVCPIFIDTCNPGAFIPGVFFDGQYICFLRHRPLTDTYGSAVFCKWDIKTKKPAPDINLGHSAKALLAVGNKYIAILKPFQPQNSPNFAVIDRNTLEKVAFWHLPVSRAMTPEAVGNFSFGEKSWLDGLDGKNDQGVILAGGTDKNCVYVLNWIPRSKQQQ